MKTTISRLLDNVISLDKNISDKLHDFEYDFLHSFFLSFTSLGSLHFTLIIAVVLLQTGNYSILTDLITVLTASLILTETIKLFVKRDRPRSRDRDVYVLQNLSFPSGHSSNSFATAMVLTGVAGLGYLPLVVAGVVAFSRVYLGQHYVSDVLAGSFIGVVVAVLI